uniref:Small ribosomal subunit protein uS12 n=1 Tax=Branchiostoma belcheri TaxID=7741 RepID=A0MQ89_BRABE|nr:ribosomal protein S23 [Branchiostoma belcheri]
MGKPRGLRSARKLKDHRRQQRWHDKSFKKAHLGTAVKASPFGGASHAKGIVLEKIGVEAKQPNSAIRKCVRVQLIKNGKKITAFVPTTAASTTSRKTTRFWFLDLVVRAVPSYIPGVRFKVVKVANVSLLALFKEKKERPRS